MIFSLPKAEEILVHSYETRNLLFSGMIDIKVVNFITDKACNPIFEKIVSK